MADTAWRKSSYSDNGDCVEIATTANSVRIRNSNHPDRVTLMIPSGVLAAFVNACSTSEFDDLA